MESVYLKINSDVYDHVMWLLKQFDSKDVEIVSNDFYKNKMELDESLRLMDSGEMEYVSLEELKRGADEVIARYED